MEIDDLRETASLAHLNLGDEELAAAFPAFEMTLAYFAAMQAADRDETLVRADVPAGQNAGARAAGADFFRKDAAASAQDSASLLLDNAGERDGRFVVIPNVL